MAGWLNVGLGGLLTISMLLPPALSEEDRLSKAEVLTFAAVGLAMGLVGLGLLRRMKAAYYLFLVTAWVVGLGFVLIGAVATDLSTTARAVFCGIGLMLSWVAKRMGTDVVRAEFGLTNSARMDQVRRVGWALTGLGIVGTSIAFVDEPIAQFGFWLSRTQALALNLAFSLASVAVGWGLLRTREWARPLVACFCAASLVFQLGVAWEPNPGMRLPPDSAIGKSTAAVALLILTVLAGYSIWVVYFRWPPKEAGPETPGGEST